MFALTDAVVFTRTIWTFTLVNLSRIQNFNVVLEICSFLSRNYNKVNIFEHDLCFTTVVAVIISVHITGFTHTSSGFNITHQKFNIIVFPTFLSGNIGRPAVLMSGTSCYWPVTFSIKKRTRTCKAPIKYFSKSFHLLLSNNTKLLDL